MTWAVEIVNVQAPLDVGGVTNFNTMLILTMMCRFLVLRPGPHLAEHSLHSSHSDTSHGTATRNGKTHKSDTA